MLRFNLKDNPTITEGGALTVLCKHGGCVKIFCAMKESAQDACLLGKKKKKILQPERSGRNSCPPRALGNDHQGSLFETRNQKPREKGSERYTDISSGGKKEKGEKTMGGNGKRNFEKPRRLCRKRASVDHGKYRSLETKGIYAHAGRHQTRGGPQFEKGPIVKLRRAATDARKREKKKTGPPLLLRH